MPNGLGLNNEAPLASIIFRCGFGWRYIDGQKPASKAFFTMVTVEPYAEHYVNFHMWLHKQVIHMMRDGVWW